MTRWRPGDVPGRLGRAGRAAAPAVRVIVDNDFAGDPDDLFQLAHHLLLPSVDVRGVISSHLRPGDFFDPGPHSAEHGVERVERLAAAMRVELDGVLVAGSEIGMSDEVTPVASAGVDRIVAEARAEGPPLLVVAGGGLTEVASALLVAPDIADRFTLVWIGGPEDPDLAEPPPGNPTPEYNLAIDVPAARAVLASGVELWQVPRQTYRQCLVSTAELTARLSGSGPLGELLLAELGGLQDMIAGHLGARHDTYVLGDQPLVLLTGLQTPFESSPASSEFVRRPAPTIGDDGGFVSNPDGREIRVWTRVDARLMFEDMWLRFAALDEWASAAG